MSHAEFVNKLNIPKNLVVESITKEMDRVVITLIDYQFYGNLIKKIGESYRVLELADFKQKLDIKSDNFVTELAVVKNNVRVADSTLIVLYSNLLIFAGYSDICIAIEENGGD